MLFLFTFILVNLWLLFSFSTISVLSRLNGRAEERIVPCLGIAELYLAHAV